MSKPDDSMNDWESQRKKIIGLGEHSLQKSYYPELQRRLAEMERFRALLDQANDAIFLLRVPSGDIVDTNRFALDQLGYTLAAIRNLSLAELVPPSAWRQIETFFGDGASVGGDGETFLTQLHRQDESAFPVEITMRLVAFDEIVYAIAVARDISERLQAEQELSKAEEDWKNIFQAIGHPAMILDANFHILSVNQATLKATGKSEDELRGRHCHTLFHCLDHPPEACPAKSLIEGDQIQTEEMVMEALGRVFLVSCTPVFDPDGKLDKIIHIATDINDRIEAEQALRESEQRLNLALQGTKAGLWDWYVQTDELIINQRWADMIGYSLEALTPITGSDWRQLCHPNDLDRSDQILEQHFNGERDFYQVELRMKHQDGDWIWVMDRGRVVEWDRDGNPVRMVGTQVDITDRKEMEKELRQNRDFLQGVFNSIQDGISVLNTDLTIRYTNPVMEKWYPKSVPLIGKKCHHCYQNRDEPCDPCPTLRSLETGMTEVDVVPGLPGSAVEWIELYSYPLRDSQTGEITGVIEFVRDITERVHAEQELSLYRLHLEDLVEQRTTQLERSNRDLEMFAYSVSHDLRAPLRHIEGFARILEEKIGSQDEAIQRYFGKIYQASERMKNLIGDLLTYSRLGRRQLNLIEVSLDEIVQEMIAQYRLDLDDRHVEWKVGPLGLVEADPDMLTIVFDNLIANAIKFTRPRDVAIIDIGAEPKDDSVEIYVKDNGVGFDMNYAHKLFGVFQRLHNEDEFPGTGIGLANVKRIIQNHGGKVRAEGEVDHGAIFFITLPRTRKGRQ